MRERETEKERETRKEETKQGEIGDASRGEKNGTSSVTPK